MPELAEGVEGTELEAQEETEVVETEVEVNTDFAINAPLDEVADPEVFKKIVKKLRAENMRTRTKKNEASSELEEFKAWKESQLTEAEKLQARVDVAEKRAATLERAVILKEFGLDSDDEELAELVEKFVVGSAEEMRRNAQLLATKIAKPSVTKKFETGDRSPLKNKSVNSGGSFLVGLAKRDLGA